LLISPSIRLLVTREPTGSEALVCRAAFGLQEVPETLVVTAKPLPRNANGKVMKRQLREALTA
jgi:acyl-CoA synthetase (AMP-forming)/AMP-acid ligase II